MYAIYALQQPALQIACAYVHVRVFACLRAAAGAGPAESHEDIATALLECAYARSSNLQISHAGNGCHIFARVLGTQYGSAPAWNRQ